MMKPFQHQIDFMNTMITKTKDTRIIINASPVASGKSANAISAFYYQYLSYTKIKNEKHVILVTCPNQLVLEEMIKNCNAENEISYWYIYEHQLIPSLRIYLFIVKAKINLFCEKPRKYEELQKKKRDSSSPVEPMEEFYFYNEYLYCSKIQKELKNSKLYKTELKLPNVIFTLPSSMNEILNDSLFMQYVDNILIDEFLIPSFKEECCSLVARIINECIIDNIILLSASCPNTLENFQVQEPDFYDVIKNYDISYLFDFVFIFVCETSFILKNKNKYKYRHGYLRMKYRSIIIRYMLLSMIDSFCGIIIVCIASMLFIVFIY